MRQWFQAKLGERLLQAGQMAKDRALLRRGAAKMQDGLLGQQDEAGTEAGVEDDMQIRVGDEVHNHYESPASSVPASSVPASPSVDSPSLLSKVSPLLLAGVIGASSVGLPWAISAFNANPTTPSVSSVTDPAVDTDTQYMLELVPNEE